MVRAAVVASALLALTGCDQGVADAKDQMARSVKDPGSIQFRDVERCSNNDRVIKGEYNAKNDFGAYTGFRPFLYSYGVAATAEDGDAFRAKMLECYGPAAYDPEWADK